jgi:hypothetical protein
MLQGRGIVRQDLTIADPALLQFYAAPLQHWLPAPAATRQT